MVRESREEEVSAHLPSSSPDDGATLRWHEQQTLEQDHDAIIGTRTGEKEPAVGDVKTAFMARGVEKKFEGVSVYSGGSCGLWLKSWTP